ncbi:MAG: cold-shock protein [Bradymonadaceae bacterium]
MEQVIEENVTGRVKWFNNAKGYGFIRADEVDEDVFVHHSEIEDDGFRTLKADETVEFTLEKTPKGLQASGVIRNKDL